MAMRLLGLRSGGRAVVGALAMGLACCRASDADLRTVHSLDGPWLFQTNGAPAEAWKTVGIPCSFEEHEGTDWDGVGWYRRTMETASVGKGRRVLLHFEAAATEAEVWLDGVRLGSHLGGWTPFRFEVTQWLAGLPAGSHEIRVRLDERVGHNTQGFLPIVQPHFGGLWQGVQWLEVGDVFIDDLRLQAWGDMDRQAILLAIPLAGGAPERAKDLRIRWRVRGGHGWESARLAIEQRAALQGREGERAQPHAWCSGGVIQAALPQPSPAVWAPGTPSLYEVEITLAGDGGHLMDRVRTRAAFREIRAMGNELQLNGHPLSVRGVLNWGYHPPRLAPAPGDTVFRHDLQFIRERGFNLMKFCLWVPPKRYLELADEMGVLTWMEYPTWHPQLTAQHLDRLRHEFAEFFAYDRNHPSVILRSLTCETGAGADLDVIRSLYDLAHESIPGAVVEDDSSWIQWNRVTDFYDDHPYGNNHDWVATLTRLRQYIAERESKPLVLGESISADTWLPPETIERRLGTERPYWAPKGLDAQARWLSAMNAIGGWASLRCLLNDSLRYGLLMRKYQIEAFRREIPSGGYVVSVIRDIPSASMGLIDYLGQPKWSVDAWAWHGETLCLLKTDDDRRSFCGGEPFTGEILVSHFGTTPIEKGELYAELELPDRGQGNTRTWCAQGLRLRNGALTKVLDCSAVLPQVTAPEPVRLAVRLQAGSRRWRNEWRLWVIPSVPADGVGGVQAHASLSAGQRDLLNLSAGTSTLADLVLVAARLDEDVERRLADGGRVLLLPAGEKGTFRRADHWFLRGAPYVGTHPLTAGTARDMLVDLQHFDLGGQVIPELPFLEQVDPILMLWDTHDHGTVRTHGLVFETKAGRGRLLVSALPHERSARGVGGWLLGEMVRHLGTDHTPRNSLSDAVWQKLKTE